MEAAAAKKLTYKCRCEQLYRVYLDKADGRNVDLNRNDLLNQKTAPSAPKFLIINRHPFSKAGLSSCFCPSKPAPSCPKKQRRSARRES